MSTHASNYFASIPSQLAAFFAEHNSDLLKIIALLPDFCTNYFVDKPPGGALPNGAKLLAAGAVYFEDFCLIKEDICQPNQQLFIGKGTKIEPGVMIIGPSIILNSCQLKHCAYLRGGVFLGADCVVGHSTEIKESILLEQTAAGHFNYLGNSIVGSYVNLGAGAKLANLEFRTLAQKKAGQFPRLKLAGQSTKLSKLGAVLGDGCEVGCNAVLAPGSFVGMDCQILPNTSLAKGFYSKGQRL